MKDPSLARINLFASGSMVDGSNYSEQVERERETKRGSEREPERRER
jgi:hypothetical protein